MLGRGIGPVQVTTRRLLHLILIVSVLAPFVYWAGLQYLGGAGVVTVPTLSHSVASAAGGFVGQCHRRRGSSWTCALVSDDASDAGISYAVAVHGRCWTGRLTRTGGMVDLPPRTTGCIDALDRPGSEDGSDYVGRGYY